MARKVLWWVLGIVIVVVAGLLVWMWLDDEAADVTTNNNETQQAEEQQTQSQLEQITQDPQSYIGQTVTVEGEVQDAINNRVFSIADDPVDEEVLVITRNSLTDQQIADMEPLFQDNPNVEVTGEFREFIVADIESELEIGLDQEIEAEFEDRYVIVADNMTFTDSGQEFDFLNGNEATTDQSETNQDGATREDADQQDAGSSR